MRQMLVNVNPWHSPLLSYFSHSGTFILFWTVRSVRTRWWTKGTWKCFWFVNFIPIGRVFFILIIHIWSIIDNIFSYIPEFFSPSASLECLCWLFYFATSLTSLWCRILSKNFGFDVRLGILILFVIDYLLFGASVRRSSGRRSGGRLLAMT